MSFPYAKKQESIGIFLTNIVQGGKPSKVDNAHLAVIGLTSSNDRPLVPLFKALGFVQTDGKPADRWSQYRDRSKSKAVLAEGIKQAYPEFFSAYPDAQNRSNDVLKNVVKAKSDFGEAGADMVVRTFKTLVGFADFSGLEGTQDNAGDDSRDVGGSGGSDGRGDRKAHPQVAINIQLQLPADADEDTYDKLFEAMAKHLKL